MITANQTFYILQSYRFDLNELCDDFQANKTIVVDLTLENEELKERAEDAEADHASALADFEEEQKQHAETKDKLIEALEQVAELQESVTPPAV